MVHSIDALRARQIIANDQAEWTTCGGYVGVATFFVISGFIIFKTSRNEFGDPRGIAQFAIKRVIRIFPIYWIAAAIFIVLSPHHGAYSRADIGFSFLLVPHLVPAAGNMHPLVGQAWTLQYELLFYLIFTLGLSFSRRIGQALIIATIVALVTVGAWMMPVSDLSEPTTITLYWTRPILLLFVVGMLFAIAEPRIRPRLRIPHPFPLMIGLIASWFLYAWLLAIPPNHQLVPPSLLVIWLLCSLCVFVSIFGQPRQGLFEPVAEAFGDASYSVYLFHTLVLSALLRLKIGAISPTLFVIATLVGANLFGLLLYRMVEKPILRFGRGRLLAATSA